MEILVFIEIASLDQLSNSELVAFCTKQLIALDASRRAVVYIFGSRWLIEGDAIFYICTCYYTFAFNSLNHRRKAIPPFGMANIRQVFKRGNPLLAKRCMSTAPKPLRFDEQTAIVTGAGRGLGREYALLLASRGANVVVNDFDGAASDKQANGSRKSVAQQVVNEILLRWPKAQAHADSNTVSTEAGSNQLVESSLDKFGRIDILINNAGILRDVSFAKMTVEHWDQVHNVHLRGSFLVSRACWAHMRKQQFGRIIMTSSTSGLYGNFGQANYSAAKMGLIGLSNTLAIEGRKNNIHCNAVVPMAASRMTRDILPGDLADRLNPAYVAPLVAWLCHAECQESGLVVEAAGGWYGRHRWQRAKGKCMLELLRDDGKLTDDSVEKVAPNWNQISSFDNASHPESFGDHLNELLTALDSNK